MSSLIHRHQWYALRIRSRFEGVAARHLRSTGCEEYLPLYTSSRRWSDRIKKVELPLFPGYMFCKFDIHDRLPIVVAPGVMSIVGIGKTPAPISESEILSIRQISASGLHYEPWPFLKDGQCVSVERGPLAGLEGTVLEVKTNWRLILSLPLLQRSVAVEINRDCVKPLKPGIQALNPTAAGEPSQSCRTRSVNISVLTLSSPL
jgi:transcriptional antiterminator RfaH